VPEIDKPALFERHFVLPRPSRVTAWALLGLALVTAFLYREALFGGRVIFRRDVSMVWLPQVEALVRSVTAGSWPLWDPFSGFGRPLLADPRAGILYPPTWFNFILPPRIFYTLYVSLHLLFSGWGAFVLARRFRLSPAAAFTAAGLWIASGPLFSLTLMWHHLAGAAWIPWMFAALDRALDSGRGRDVLLAALTFLGQVCAGSPDLTALTLVALGAYALARRPAWRLAPAERPHGMPRTALLALGLGLLLSAPQWLPTLEWSLRSKRTALPYAEATSWSQHPLALLEVLLPLRFDWLPLNPEALRLTVAAREPWLHSIHLGAVGCALLVAGLAGRRPRRLYLLGLLLGSLVFGLGKYTPAHAALVELLPPLAMLRFPVKALVLAALAWSLLAGFGVETWLRRDALPESRRWRAMLLPTLLVALVALLGVTAGTWGADALGRPWLVLQPYATLRDALAPLSALLAVHAALALLLLLLALRLRARRPAFAPALLVALALASPLLRHARMGWTGPPDLWELRPRALAYLGRDPLPRVYAYDYSILSEAQLRANPGAERSYTIARLPRGWDPALAVFLGVQLYLNPPTAARWGVSGSFDRDILGFDAPWLADLNGFLRESELSPTHLRLLRLGAVNYVAALAPGRWWDDLEPLGEVIEVFERPIRLFRVPGTRPRAWVVGGARVADGDEALRVLDSPDFDAAREVLLASGTPRKAPLDPVGEARITAWRPDQITLEARLDAPGILVLADAFDPGWRVTIDGRPGGPLLRANVAFRAVALNAGRHVVELTYRPWAVPAGFGLAGLGVAGVAIAALIARRRRAAA
jgi:hypothetical protein